MILTVRQMRDLFNGLNFLATEPIITHLLNFRIKAAIMLVQPHADTLRKSETEVVRAHSEESENNGDGQPKWKSPEDEKKAETAMQEILESFVEVVGLTKISWDLFEKAKCSYLDKVTGGRKTEPLVVSAQLLIALDPIIDGQPAVA